MGRTSVLCYYKNHYTIPLGTEQIYEWKSQEGFIRIVFFLSTVLQNII